MPESVLTLLKFCLVAVLYLFFFRVLRAVWAELREPDAAPPPPPPPPQPQPARAATAPPAAPRQQWAPAPAPAPAPTPSGTTAGVRVTRPPALAGRSFPVDADEMTIGRAPGCAVLLDDPTVSSLHARLTRRGDQVVLEDLGSRNGTLLNGRQLKVPTALAPGDRLGVGPNVELEVLP